MICSRVEIYLFTMQIYLFMYRVVYLYVWIYLFAMQIYLYVLSTKLFAYMNNLFTMLIYLVRQEALFVLRMEPATCVG
jgi:hypothetical protein